MKNMRSESARTGNRGFAKRFLFSFFIFHSSFFICGAFAAPEKIATVRLAPMDVQIASINQICQLAGNAMLAPVATAKLMTNPFAEFLGPARSDAAWTAFLYVEGDDASCEDNDITFVYPVTKTKADFLASCDGAIETNGVVCVEHAPAPFGETYLKFTDDGKWVIVAGEMKYLDAALAELPVADKAAPSANIEFEATSKLVKMLPKALAEIEGDEDDKKIVAELAKTVEMVDSFDLSAKFGANGVDLASKVRTVPDTPLAASGAIPLGDNPFAGFPADALVASSYAKNSGYDPDRDKAQFKALAKLVEKHLGTNDFFTVSAAGPVAVCTLDIPAQIENCKNRDCGDFDAEEFAQEFCKACRGTGKPCWDGDAFGSALVMKGAKVKYSLDERFAATIPEASARKPYVASVVSLYQMVKAAADIALAKLDGAEGASFKMFLSSMAEPGKSSIATAFFKDGKDIESIVRISPDEIRGISSAVNVAMGVIMQQAMIRAAAYPACDCDDDDDDDDDED